MKQQTRQAGVTLIELMMAVGILGVISAIAIPQYIDYTVAARVSAMDEGINQIELFEEERRLAKGEYAEGNWHPQAASYTLRDNIGWDPRTSNDRIKYTVTCAVKKGNPNPLDECTRTSTYTITAEHLDDANACRQSVGGAAPTDC